MCITLWYNCIWKYSRWLNIHINKSTKAKAYLNQILIEKKMVLDSGQSSLTPNHVWKLHKNISMGVKTTQKHKSAEVRA